MGRRNEADFFPWFSTTIDSRMLQTGTLDGIEVRSRRARWQVTPYATADDTRLRDVPAGTPWEDTAGIEGGADGKLVWEDRLVWDFTVNPDFSQVESDQPQVLANQRFEVFFPEKRPFFIENASYFATPLELLFTRRIVEPTAGVRLTGQDGRWSLSGLAIEDERPPESAVDPTVGNALLWWAGLRRRGEGDSFVGGALMHRVGPTATTSIASVDGRQRFHENWSLTYQLAASHDSPDDPSSAERADQALYAALNGGGQLWDYDLTFKDIGASFSAPVGFVPRLGIRKLTQYASYRFEPKLPWLLALKPYLNVERVADQDDLRLDLYVEPGLIVELPHATTLTLHGASLDERVKPADFPVLAQPVDFGQERLGLHWRSAFTTQLLLDGALHWGDYVNFVPAAGDPPAPGAGVELELSVAWFPTTVLELELTYLLTELDHYDGTPIFETRLARLKTVYHFDHDWQLRLILDGGSTRSDPLETSLTTASAAGADLLLQWQPRPGDAFYLGFTAREDSLPSVAAPGLDEPGERLPSGQRAFLKYSKRFDF
jgi:hypothetical protein